MNTNRRKRFISIKLPLLVLALVAATFAMVSGGAGPVSAQSSCPDLELSGNTISGGSSACQYVVSSLSNGGEKCEGSGPMTCRNRSEGKHKVDKWTADWKPAGGHTITVGPRTGNEGTGSGTFSGGVVTKELRSAMDSELSLDTTGNDSAADKAKFRQQIAEEERKDEQVAYEYCMSLPEKSKVAECIGSIGKTRIIDEHEGLSGPISPATTNVESRAADWSTSNLSATQRYASANCSYIWMTYSHSGKSKDYIFFTKYQMWMSTNTFLGSRTDPDSCGRQPVKVERFDHIGKGFSEICETVYLHPTDPYISEYVCRPQMSVPISMHKRAYNVDSYQSYESSKKPFPANTDIKCRMAQFRARSNNQPLVWGGRGYQAIKVNSISSGCKGDLTSYTWW